ncbi:Trehalose-phosphatase [Smittium culicis]|uniref:Trehalose-phosphatase n=1 Tax=Smittium culicis TaxID=133412 RepID=A0A1R1X3N5_9FUNG|nr:Trehalose-phosphatase [Smittium culicis]
MLHSNSIGFQTFSYARHLCNSCTRILGLESTPKIIQYNDEEVMLEIIPIGIDVDSLLARKLLPDVKEKEESILRLYKGKKIIFGKDKLDIVNGILQKLNAFEQFLNFYPEWRDKVVLIQVVIPGNSNQPKLESKVSEKITSINSKYGSLEFSPVHFYRSFLEQDLYIALMKIADLGLITVVRDGMNTSSLEYIVCQEKNKNPLILSEFTGTAGSISGAIQINPWNTDDVAHQIKNCLVMDEYEKANRHSTMYNFVRSHNSEFWANSFINAINTNCATQSERHSIPLLDTITISESYKNSKKRLILLDYDGTLVPITNIPANAIPSSKTIESLTLLCEDPKNAVWVISGRDSEFLNKHLGSIKGLGLSAEHGGFVRHPYRDWESLVDQLDLSWKTQIKNIFDFFTERTSGSFVEEKVAAITWHYRNANQDYAMFQCNQCHSHLESAIASNLPVEILVGKKCLEVRPKEVNKGEIVSRLLESSSNVGLDFLFVAGDDRTDEDMFITARNYVNSIIKEESDENPLKLNNKLPKSSSDDNNASKEILISNPNLSKQSLDFESEICQLKHLDCFTVIVGNRNKKSNAFWNVPTTYNITDLIQALSKND